MICLKCELKGDSKTILCRSLLRETDVALRLKMFQSSKQLAADLFWVYLFIVSCPLNGHTASVQQLAACLCAGYTKRESVRKCCVYVQEVLCNGLNCLWRVTRGERFMVKTPSSGSRYLKGLCSSRCAEQTTL